MAIALLAAACGSAGDTPDNAGVAAANDSVDEVADANPDSLAVNDDVRLTEILDVHDGSVQTLTSAVDGDRPVLLWFWAPH